MNTNLQDSNGPNYIGFTSSTSSDKFMEKVQATESAILKLSGIRNIRHVRDLVRGRTELHKFLNHPNRRHPNVRFTRDWRELTVTFCRYTSVPKKMQQPYKSLHECYNLRSPNSNMLVTKAYSKKQANYSIRRIFQKQQMSTPTQKTQIRQGIIQAHSESLSIVHERNCCQCRKNNKKIKINAH